MFCPFCGTQLPEGAAFCSSCGSPVGNLQQMMSQQQAMNQQQMNLQSMMNQQQTMNQQRVIPIML